LTHLKLPKTSQVFHTFKPLSTPNELDDPDELHIAINTYKGCPYKCVYCYIYGYTRALDIENPSTKTLFRRRFKRDLEALEKLNFSKCTMYISPSCEPLYPELEKKYGNTLYVLKSVGEYSFMDVVILTKNPSLLLEPEYLEVLNRKNTRMEVSIPFLDSRFEGYAPSPSDRMEAVSSLTKEGFKVYLRVEPVTPSFGGIVGQSKVEFKLLISEAKKAGVCKVISRCLLLPIGVCKIFPTFYRELKPYYQQYGYRNGTYYVLDCSVRLKLIKPLYDACKTYGIELWVYSDATSKYPTLVHADNIYLPSKQAISW
jgi:DNA repair photolyase